MICPNCQQKMKEVKTSSLNSGFFITFNQCSECGGLWFDRFDMPQISNQEALKIDSFNNEISKNPISVKEKLLCPKDNLPLLKIVDINIPQDTFISRCRKCEGIWLNQGDLKKYKQHIKNRQIATFKFVKKDKEKTGISKTEKKVIVAIGNQIMPIPMSFVKNKILEEPFILSDRGVELLKELSQEEKMKIYSIMALDHKEKIKSEQNFINATMNILNIILKLLIKL